MATNRASTVQDIQVNAAATVLAEALHYCRQQAFGLPPQNWHGASAVWKQTCIEHAAYALERLKPIVERPKLAMVKLQSAHALGAGSKDAVGRGVEESAAFLIEPEACLYCGCVIEEEGREPYCSALCSISAENDR